MRRPLKLAPQGIKQQTATKAAKCAERGQARFNLSRKKRVAANSKKLSKHTIVGITSIVRRNENVLSRFSTQYRAKRGKTVQSASASSAVGRKCVKNTTQDKVQIAAVETLAYDDTMSRAEAP